MEYDIVIIGGGPVGLSFARTLTASDMKVLLVERAPQSSLATPAVDGRDIAMTHLSMDILERMGILDRLPEGSISPIRAAKVSNGNSPYCLNIDSKDESVSALGHLIPNHLLKQALYEEVTSINTTDIIYETSVNDVHTHADHSEVVLSNGKVVKAKLVVAADSRFSDTRRKQGISTSMLDFGRVVIVSRMEHDESHQQVAHECFLYGRTLAVLPLGGNLSSIVVTVSADQSDDLLNMSAEDFSQSVKSWFDKALSTGASAGLGNMKLVGERYSYPLVAVHANQFVKPRYALLGDAAVGMHPVTAHGFNLGLRGQDTLYQEIISAHKRDVDIGSLAVLKGYESKHMKVTKPLYHGTNEIVGLFTNESLPAKIARNALLRFSNNFPPIKHMIASKLTEKKGSSGIAFPTFLH
ncbi:MAG: ubiquinone biosynthesis UbiH/UbiF/VisC/COQ6 family hydroxylase [Enterobacterales bacterium]|jgi:ubiquinone biosynthesis UbiH/UbiF/VisC/COQ6 family hydroxylase